MSNIEALRDLYLSETGSEQSRFHIWERGEPVGDSVTPSTYSGAYRIWIRDLLRKLLDESDSPALLSIGCGNAAVEAGLVAAGYRVLAIDAMEEAVTLARAKGIDAICADVFSWEPPSRDWTVVYTDGFLGHVYDPDAGLQPVLERIRSWMLPGKGVIVNSNDDPRTDSDVQAHTDAPAFNWLSGPYLKAQAEIAGFNDIWTTWFTYQRPVSGPRERVIMTARA
ncbi:MAG: class I SAM-dependent methyltransferase [Actinomadura sp.]